MGKACALQMKKVSYRAGLFCAAGFLVGFAVCHYLQREQSERLLDPAESVGGAQKTTLPISGTAEPSQASPTKSANQSENVLPPRPRDNSVSQDKSSLFAGPELQRWRVKVWHPTIPPQLAGEFDPLEYAAAITNHASR